MIHVEKETLIALLENCIKLGNEIQTNYLNTKEGQPLLNDLMKKITKGIDKIN